MNPGALSPCEGIENVGLFFLNNFFLTFFGVTYGRKKYLEMCMTQFSKVNTCPSFFTHFLREPIPPFSPPRGLLCTPRAPWLSASSPAHITGQEYHTCSTEMEETEPSSGPALRVCSEAGNNPEQEPQVAPPLPPSPYSFSLWECPSISLHLAALSA